jgi:hypothetical protein
MAAVVRGELLYQSNFDRSIPGVRYAGVYGLPHAAATGTEVVGYWVAPFDCRLISVHFVPFAAVTGANTNSATLTVTNKGNDGAGVTTLGSQALLSTVDLTAHAKNIITEVITTDLTAGDVIAFGVTKVGTGLDVPGGLWLIGYDGG